MYVYVAGEDDIHATQSLTLSHWVTYLVTHDVTVIRALWQRSKHIEQKISCRIEDNFVTVMYLQRGPLTAENETTTHRTHRTHRTLGSIRGLSTFKLRACNCGT